MASTLVCRAFIADIVSAVPLFIAPVYCLELLGWPSPDPVATRMVAAALFGIGLSISALTGGPPLVWGVLGIFAAFFGLWSFYRINLG